MGFGSPMHWLVIGIVALLLFGNRLPEVARSLGRAWNEFKRGLNDVTDELNREPDERRKLDSPDDEDDEAMARRDAKQDQHDEEQSRDSEK